MEAIFTFAKTATPVTLLIALTLIIVFGLFHIVIILLRNSGVIKKVSAVQDSKYPELEKHLSIIEEQYNLQQKFLTNHSIHEIPALVQAMGRVEGKVDKIADIQTSQGLDIARLKALSEK